MLQQQNNHMPLLPTSVLSAMVAGPVTAAMRTATSNARGKSSEEPVWTEKRS